MNPNNKPKNFKDLNGKMDQAGKVNTQPSQPNKNFNKPEQNGSFKKPTDFTPKSASSMGSMKSEPNNAFKRPDVNSTDNVEKTNGQPNKFNNFKK